MVISRLMATEKKVNRMLLVVDHDSARHKIFPWRLNSLWPAKSPHVQGIASLSLIRLDKEARRPTICEM